MPESGLKKGLFLIMLANLLNLVVGLVNGFILPKYLSIDTYAMIKTYTLYISYAGFFHLGYLDGMYLKYGGRPLSSVSSREYGTDFWNIGLMQFVVSVILLIVGLAMWNFLLCAFAAGLFLKNINSCCQLFFQATGEFKLYSSALNYGTILSFLLSLFLIFVVKTDDARLYIGVQILSLLIVSLYLCILLNVKLGYFKCREMSLAAFKENISSGFVLMIGNFSNILFLSIDRWLVKILMSTYHFAVYSFAFAINGLIDVFISPLFVTLYNAFCKNSSPERIMGIKRAVAVWSFAIIAFAFPAKWVVEHYIDKYIEALPLVFIFFASHVFNALILGVYVNYFKARKLQKQFFWQILSMLATIIGVSLVAWLIFKSMLALAVASLLANIIWLGVNERKFKDLRFVCTDWIYLGLMLAVYLLCGLCLGSIAGFIVYIVLLVLSSLFLMRTQTLMLFNSLKQLWLRNKIL